MTAVEIVEAGFVDDDEELATADGPGRDATVRGWRRALRAWPVALVAVVVAGFAVVSAIRDAARSEARLEVLRVQPGFAAELGPGLRQVWAIDDLPPGSISGVWGDLLVLLGEGELRAVAGATGEELWRVDVDGIVLCGVGVGFGAGSSDPRVQSASGVLPCQRYVTSGSSADDVAIRTVFEQRDAATGQVVASLDRDSVVSAVWWQGELLVLEMVDDGLELRLESITGGSRWRLPVLEQTPGEDAWVFVDGERAFVTGARNLVVDRDGAIVFDSDEDLPAGVDEGGFLGPVRDGWFVDDVRDGAQRTAVFGSDGKLDLEAEGYLLPPAVDDGSVPGAVVLVPPWGMTVWDREAEEPRAEIDGHPDDVVFLLHGALVYAREGVLRAVDASSGAVRWTAELHQGDVHGTDGDVVLVSDSSSGPVLRAISVHSGEQLWTYELPSAESAPLVVGGLLLVQDGETLVRLSADG